jgi:hypothetical protein
VPSHASILKEWRVIVVARDINCYYSLCFKKVQPESFFPLLLEDKLFLFLNHPKLCSFCVNYDFLLLNVTFDRMEVLITKIYRMKFHFGW